MSPLYSRRGHLSQPPVQAPLSQAHRGPFREFIVSNRPASLGERAQQRLRLLQIERVEAFGEPAVDRS
jgi:hypothetical protein